MFARKMPVKIESMLYGWAIAFVSRPVLEAFYPDLFLKPPPPGNESRVWNPDLIKLSTDLPSGWKACYDQSSKQVFYVNKAKSKIAWTRPAY